MQGCRQQLLCPGLEPGRSYGTDRKPPNSTCSHTMTSLIAQAPPWADRAVAQALSPFLRGLQAPSPTQCCSSSGASSGPSGTPSAPVPAGCGTMFLFSKKHKTPISTYTDSYRPPCSVKKTIQEQGAQQLWKENKFVTKVNATGGGNLRVSAPTQLWMLGDAQRGGMGTLRVPRCMCVMREGGEGVVLPGLERILYPMACARWLAVPWSCTLQWLQALRACGHQHKLSCICPVHQLVSESAGGRIC